MKKRISTIVFCGWLLLNAGGIQAQESTGKLYTLQQCVETGLEKNLDVIKAGLQAETGKINWNQARLNMLPDLNASASNGINSGRSIDPFTNSYINQEVNVANYGVSSGVVLFRGLSMQNAARQNALAYEASRMDWQQSKDNVTINIILAYLQVLTNQDLLTLAINQADLSKKQVERLEIMNKDGAIKPSELSDLRGQFANDQLSIISTRNALEQSKLSLCKLMNIPYDRAMKLEPIDAATFATRYEMTPDSIYSTALREFALVKAVDLREASAVRGVKVARGQLFPTLTLNGNASTNYSSAARSDIFLGSAEQPTNDYVLINNVKTPVYSKINNFNSEKITYGKQVKNNIFTSFSLGLQIPIFNAWSQRNKIRLAQIDLKNAEYTASTTKTQLQQSIEEAHINMTTSSDRYKTLLEQVEAYRESFRAAEVRFNSGVGTSVDYLIAKNNLDRSNSNAVQAKYDYALRTKVLDYYQGKQLW
ncbi:MAG: TolC family protein [Citrobacter freundii]|nr:MAG: TolC family protein [Citrobacter freundii]